MNTSIVHRRLSYAQYIQYAVLIAFVLLAVLVAAGEAEQRSLYSSCMEAKSLEKYCRCMHSRIMDSTAISHEARRRLESDFTTDLNAVAGVEPGGEVNAEFKALTAVFVGCLNEVKDELIKK